MKDFKIYLSVASIFLMVYLIAQFNRPAPVNWNQSFYYNDKIPYGTYILYQQLNHIFPGARIKKTNASLYKTFHDSSLAAGNYIVIAKEFKTSKYDFNELVKFIKQGNSVFISCFNYTGFLADSLKLSTSYEYKNGNSGLTFTNTRINQTTYKFNRDISNQYFDKFDTSKATVIGKNSQGHSTFLNFRFGKGSLYLCVNPGMFTNYSLLTSHGAAYAATALSYLPESKNVYWDEFQNGDDPEDKSPLRVFFSNPALQWAYYITLFSLLTFVLFEMKRRQRIIPVIEPLTNSTLEFVNVVGQVYYEKRNNANIAQKKILYLLAYLRDEYHLKTNKLDDEFKEKLTSKMGIEPIVAHELVSKTHQFDMQSYVSDNELIELNKFIEKFYIKSR